MKHIILFESFDSDSGLNFNLRSTVDGYIKLKNDDPSIPGNSENEIDKLIITDPKEYFNYRLNDAKDGENRFSLDSDDILRVRIGGKDFSGRPGGVTHIMVRVPKNFDSSRFGNGLSNIRHSMTIKPDVERVFKEIESLIIECIRSGSDSSVELKYDENTDYDKDILEFIEPIMNKIGREETKNILTRIIQGL